MMHKFKRLTYKGKKIEIDEKIVPLIFKMWKLDINTSGCCQADCSFNCEHNGEEVAGTENGVDYYQPIYGKMCHNNVWIAFATMKDMGRFLNIIAEYSEDRGSMYRRMCCDKFVGRPFMGPKDQWTYSFFLANQGINKRDIGGKKISTQPSNTNDFAVRPQLAFPRKHLPYVEQQLQSALTKKRKQAK
jgi:hypothetical protein